MPPAIAPPPPDRVTLPLLRAAVYLGAVLTAWPAYDLNAGRVTLPVAAVIGFALALIYCHPHRLLGLAPFALTVAFAGTLAAAEWGWADVSAAVVGCALGVVLRVFALPRAVGRYRDLSPRALPLAVVPAVILACLLAYQFKNGQDSATTLQFCTIWAAVVFGVAAVFAWERLFRPAFEVLVEPLVRAMYRIRSAGPGVAAFPAGGPCLVMANHACWFDPIFLMKVLPRPVTPMMTSRFYDLKALKWLMARVFHAIRVQEATFRHDAPELDEAIAALDRGECVVIFPEGYLRRSEEKPLKRFGQGVWHILTARPGTPVVACWIEGGWGSYTSFFNGKPTQNKRPDVRRRVGVAVSTPTTLDADTLAEPYRTRLAVMNQVIDARKILGLPDLPWFVMPEKAEEAGEKDEE